MKLQTKSRLLMIGDSITDCGRNYQSAPADWDSFGNGYVSLVNAFLTGLCPEQKIMVINKGVNGNTIQHLALRWSEDVLSLKPDYVTIMIGVNDVWRQFDGVLKQEPTQTLSEFLLVYDDLIRMTKPLVKQIFLISPFMIEPNLQDPMGSMVRTYASAIAALATKHDLPYIDVQTPMDSFCEHLSPYIISADRVHPNLQGHAILAKSILDAFEMHW